MAAKKRKQYIPINSQPLLCKATFRYTQETPLGEYPFCLPLIKQMQSIEFDTPVTFFIGENGSGKSTILEALAHKVGFGAEGGSKNIQFKTLSQEHYSGAMKLADHIQLSWSYKPTNGYFFRAESFFNVGNYLESIGDHFGSYGGKSLHTQSHGESFFSFFNNRLDDTGFYIFDEPEAALSPNRQLALLRIINRLTKNNTAQCLIATHSPILLAYPHATIYAIVDDKLVRVSYEQTEHVQITKRFLDNPALFLEKLFDE